MKISGYRGYDHRPKNLVATSDDIRKFLKYGISLSTLKEWKKNGEREFFTIPELELNTSELIAENITLKEKLAAVTAEHGLVLTTIKIFGFRIQYKQLPSSGAKEKILAAIKIASDLIPCAISNQISVWPMNIRHWSVEISRNYARCANSWALFGMWTSW